MSFTSVEIDIINALVLTEIERIRDWSDSIGYREQLHGIIEKINHMEAGAT